MGHVVIRNEQAVFVGGGIGVNCTIQRISVHRPHVGEGHIVQGAVCLGAAVKGAVHRAGNPQRRQVEIVSAAGGKGKLFVDPFFHRQRNVCEITCVIGIIIAVALLAEQLEVIAARRKVAGNRYACRAACAVLSDLSVVKYIVIAVAKQDGNILIASRFRAGIGNLYGAARRCCNSLIARYGKAAATI